MKRQTIWTGAMILIISAFILASCGGGGGGSASDGGSAGDMTPPAATVSPVSGASIHGTTQIRITFSESMKTSSLVIGGSLASDGSSGTWSTAHIADDTLTIVPQTSWSSGSGKTLIIDATDLAGNPLSRLTLTHTVGAGAPTAGVVPANNSTVNKSTQIVVTFSESMKTGSLVLGGTMASESDRGVWSRTTNTNDTLTISPTASWTGGSGKTLTINASDLADNPVTPISLNYNVDTTLASATASPQNGSALAVNQSFIITFTKSMNTASLLLGGALAPEAGAPVWSTTLLANDTLTINPGTQWSVGEARTLTINAGDTTGNAMTPLNITYDTGILFVSTTGSSLNDGSRTSPLDIRTALDRTGYPEIHVQGGMYRGITIRNGITLKGSYDASWTAANVFTTPTPTIFSGAPDGSLIVQNVGAPVSISAVKVGGANAINPSESSYAIRVLNSTGPVAFQSVAVYAGGGAAGSDGAAGQDAPTDPASPGYSGASAGTISGFCDDTTQGAGGLAGGYGSVAGGAGGNGGTADTNCSTLSYNAKPGTNGTSSVSGASGGWGGATCSAGYPGNKGQDGQNGAGGSGGSGGSVSSGLWIPSSGTDGSLGTDGVGGGGGGGSGGCDNGLSTDTYGAGGGGGGAGGTRSLVAGKGGKGGGAGFGIFIVSSTVIATDSTITMGTGGKGGNGGRSGIGQQGGDVGRGGPSVSGSLKGGDGGHGGKGGDSGGGGGGAGGVVYGIYRSGSTVTVTNTTYTGGTPGAGGSGANNGVNGSVVDMN